MKSSKIEERLLRDILEIEDLVSNRQRQLPGAQWQRNSILATDRNALIRFGVSKIFSELEYFMEGVILNCFFDRKKYSCRTKKYQLFERDIVRKLSFADKATLVRANFKLSMLSKTFLQALPSLKENVSRHLSEMEPKSGCNYKGRSIYDLAVFKGFSKDAGKVTDFLINQLIKTS